VPITECEAIRLRSGDPGADSARPDELQPCICWTRRSAASGAWSCPRGRCRLLSH